MKECLFVRGAYFATTGSRRLALRTLPRGRLSGLAATMDVKQIGTHNGTFHCDEALACFLLRQTEQFRTAKIVRTRDLEVLDQLDCVVDVGGTYDADRLRFDHHQRGFFETFTDQTQTKLSSAGLVYKHFGREVLRLMLADKVQEKEDVEQLFHKVYKSFIEEIDGVDNGVNQFAFDGEPNYERNSSLPTRVSRLNPNWNDKAPDFDANFLKAVELVGSEFEQYVGYVASSWLPGKAGVRAAVEQRFEVHPSGKILRFREFAPWKDHLMDLEKELGIEVLFVLYPDQAQKWRVQCLNVSPTSFELRKGLPKAWRGLNGDKLSEASGIPGGVFCHISGFIGGNETESGALQMADAALNAPEPAS